MPRRARRYSVYLLKNLDVLPVLKTYGCLRPAQDYVDEQYC
jgi:hypothetical protein